jgi:two-component system, chemotaxis family, chemotaxis protein CheY
MLIYCALYRPSTFMPPPSDDCRPPARRVLCVDDEPAMRCVLESLLRREGWKVETAIDGLEGWEKVAGDLGRFEVVVTDSQMPRLDGLHLVERLWQAGFSGRIVVFSSNLTPQTEAQFRSQGAVAVLQKAVATLDEVAAAINGHEQSH